jgi:predicted MFS family arabinose efflux permease
MHLTGLWRQSDFRKLWIGQAISQLGSCITACGLPLAAVLTLGASPVQMGMLSGVSGASVLAFGLFAGAWADRLRRRPILIAADLGRALVLGTIPLAALFHRLTIAQLYIAAAAGAALTVLFDVSYQAYLPSLVGPANLMEGNSKLVLTESIAGVAGPGLTGVLTQLVTAPIAILADAVSFVCSAVSLWMIRKPEPRPPCAPRRHIGREIAEGLAATWRDPILRALCKRTAMASTFLGFFGSLYFLFAIRDLRLSAALIGVIVSAGGAASLLGAFASRWLVSRFGFGPTLIASAIAPGLGMLLLPLAHGSVPACAAVLIAAQLCDVAWPVYSINETSLRQAIAPDALLGRVNAAMHLMFHGIWPLGALAGGILAGACGIRCAMLVGALGFLLSNVWLVFSPIRRLRALPRYSICF